MSLAENRVVLGIGKQAGKGTPVAASTFPRWEDGTEVQLDLKTEIIREGDGTPAVARLIKNVQFYKGKIAHGKARTIDAGFLLKGLFGTASDVISGAGVPYTHTFTPANTRDYYTVYLQYLLSSVDAVQVNDALIHSALIQGDAGKVIKMEYDFNGLTGQDFTGAMTASYDASSAPLLFYGGTFNVDGSTGGVVAPYIKMVKIDYKHVLDDTMQTEAVTLADFVNTTREVDVEFDVLFQDFTQFKKVYWNAGTTDSAIIGSGSIDVKWLAGGSDANNSLELICNNLHYSAAQLPPPKLAGKALVQKITAKAVINPEMTAKLLNSQSTQY